MVEIELVIDSFSVLGGNEWYDVELDEFGDLRATFRIEPFFDLETETLLSERGVDTALPFDSDK